MTSVASLRSYVPQEGDVRVDRATPWGNPYIIGPDGTRVEVVRAYRLWILQRGDLIDQLRDLKPRRLLCWCSPELCHGDVLVELLEATQ